MSVGIDYYLRPWFPLMKKEGGGDEDEKCWSSRKLTIFQKTIT